MGSFLSGLFGVVGPRLEEKHQQELELQAQKKKAEYGTYWNSMQSAATRLSQLKSKGNLTDEEKKEAQSLAAQYAWSEQQLGKLTKSSKPLAEGLQKVGGFVKQILTHPSPKGKLQPPTGDSQQQGGNPTSTAPGGQPRSQQQGAVPAPGGNLQPPADSAQGAPAPPSGKLQPPAQPSMQGAMGSPEVMERVESERKRASEEEEYKRWLERGKQVLGPDADPRDLAEFAGSKGARLPAKSQPGNRTPERWKVGDKEFDVDKDPKTGVRYLGKEEWEIPEGATRVAATTSSAMPRFGTQLILTKDAKKLAENGQVFNDPEGKPINLDKIPEGMALQPMTTGGKLSYITIDPHQQKYVIGNVAYAATPQELSSLATGGGTVLGQQNVGGTTSGEHAAVDAQGNPIAQRLTTTRTPNAPGVQGSQPPAAQRPSTPPQASQGASPQGTTKPQAQPQPSKPIGAPPQVPPPVAGSRPLPGMQPGTYNKMLDRITSVREAATQIFGDPSQPSMRSMRDFSKLADDPKSREKIGKALLLTFDGMSKASGEAGITGSAGPVSLHAGGGVIDLMEKYFGVPAAQAAQVNETAQKAVQDLTPEEREAYDATMSTFATVVGLRSLTKASASAASVGTIEREIPTIGLYTADSQQYLDKLQHLAEIVYNGSKGVPKGMWDQNPGLYEFIQQLPSQTGQMKKSAAPPSPKGKLSPPSSAANSGLPDAARKQLKEGFDTTFSNGQVWTLKNGQPTQVK